MNDMKILLLGDYSMVHQNLKDGLLELGYHPVLATNGDGWKKFPAADLPLTVPTPRTYFTRAYRKFFHTDYSMIRHVKKNFSGYDIVQLMSADLFPWESRKLIYDLVFDRNKKVFVSVPGDDCYNYQEWIKGGFIRYAIFENYPEYTCNYDEVSDYSKKINSEYRYVLNRAYGVNAIIPYEGEYPTRNLPNRRPLILLPLNLARYEDIPNKVSGKIVIYHGINYGKKKGAEYITRALDIISAKYPNDVECIVSEHLPYHEFLEVVKKTNIVVDQCKSYSYGITALIAMAQNKVVLSGAEPEAVAALGNDECPVINIIPDVQQIVDTLEHLIENKKSIEEIGNRGRAYVKKYHDHVEIARQYLREWEK